jgi:SAM-dependent methyltransferase
VVQSGSLAYTMRTEGDLVQHAVARVSPELDRTRVRFIQGDACDLGASFPSGEQFHVVLAANLLCRLPFPSRFLSSLPQLIVGGGYLIMPSPYTWLEQYTPREEWIGGFVDQRTGREVKSFDGLKERLEGEGYFTLVEAFDLPFFIRETARKNQWSVSHVSVWRRTDKAAAAAK